MATRITMLELVSIVGDLGGSENEVVATVAHLVNSGLFELCGNFRGRRIVLEPSASPSAL